MIKETKDYDFINYVLNDPEVFDRISEDDQKTIIIGQNDNFIWLEICDKKGLFFLHPHNVSTYWAHIHILKNHRDCSKQAASGFIEWLRGGGLPERVNKLITEIPVTYPEVYHFVKNNFNIRDEGLNRASILKKGKYVDQHILGATIKELTG